MANPDGPCCPLCLEDLEAHLRVAVADKETVNLLLLSGGGSRGAWGAGVLNGWSDRTTEPRRPAFDVVTGISTGAVQATSAFLGGRDQDALLERGYTETTNGDVYGWWPPGMRSLSALRETLRKKYVTRDAVEQVKAAAEADPTRKLLIGTVELERGRFQVWDMLDLAKRGAYDCYLDVILASSANPAGIWPVEIEGHQQVDGGVCARVFAATVARAAACARAGAACAAEPGRQRVWALINGKLHKGSEKVRRWWPPGIMARGLDLALKEGIAGSLYGAWYDLNKAGPAWEFRCCWIPQQMKGLPKSSEYEPAKMKPLFDAGRVFGSKEDWNLGLPPADPECD